jgi:hypothetical protein
MILISTLDRADHLGEILSSSPTSGQTRRLIGGHKAVLCVWEFVR